MEFVAVCLSSVAMCCTVLFYPNNGEDISHSIALPQEHGVGWSQQLTGATAADHLK